MIKDQKPRIGRKVDVGIRCVLGARPGEVFYPLAGLVPDVACYKVVLGMGGYETKKIVLVRFVISPLKIFSGSQAKKEYRSVREDFWLSKKIAPGSSQRALKTLHGSGSILKLVFSIVDCRSSFIIPHPSMPNRQSSILPGSPTQIFRSVIDFSLDLDRTNLELWYFSNGVEGCMGQNIGPGFRIMEGHGNNTWRGDF